jgi:predicted ATPase with chaperone activity
MVLRKKPLVPSEARRLIELTVKRMQLSARAYHCVLKLAGIEMQHAAEAAQYRPRQQVM